MIRANVLIFSVLLLATVLGVYAQDIEYFLSSNFNNLSPFVWLAVVTVSSWFLYVYALVLVFFFTWKGMFKKNQFLVYLFVILGVGVLISLWSLFVLAMSGG
ncbi:hypothetical protein CVD28_09060 [Bacillus sp. M6-12]|uniref:hypothetical protein n=1 Tax=Bacillus sp. M6-12 TaxID=2054166 RepID=UPI000C762817|nr:hypothetical protein [Bacillus sp. M6-12]PLS17839.1 hypothetical protein CVD28_09060 [Bacillus sp. M6-12]